MDTESDDCCPKCKENMMMFGVVNNDRRGGFLYYQAVCQSCEYKGYQKFKVEFVEWIDYDKSM